MQTSDFDYELPLERIAQYPLAERSASRLLVLDGVSGRCEDRKFELQGVVENSFMFSKESAE